MSYALFRTIGAISRDHIVANTCGCLSVVWLLLFSGFIISRGMNVFVHLKIAQVLHVLQDHSCKEFFFSESVHKWLVWGIYTSPLMYAQTALSVNEFFGGTWKHVSTIVDCKKSS